jgi:peptide chain release factor 1
VEVAKNTKNVAVSMNEKWQKIISEYEELEQKLIGQLDPDEMRKISKKVSYMRPSYEKIKKFVDNLNAIEENQELLKDKELADLAREEISGLKIENEKLELEIIELLSPKDPDAHKDAIVEIRAGTGGDEAGLFAGEIARMYMRYAELRGFKVEMIEKNETETGAVKEVSFAVRGNNAYSYFTYESGVHRVQRVPKTESKGRLHTSAATVYACPEHDAEEIEIPDNELKIDTFRASGAGGQHVNTTDSAVRITHIPTGIVASCQDEKSQHKNKEKAYSILISRVIEQKNEEEAKKLGEERRSKIKSGDRSEKIRTWNFPQDRITDHRIKKSFFGIKEIMEGNMDKIIDELKKFDK